MKLIKQFKAGRTVQKLKSSREMTSEELVAVQRDLVGMGSSAIRPLLDCLGHGDARSPAMEVLGKLLSDDTLGIFLEALSSPNPAIVSGCTRVLAEGKSYDASPLLGLLSDTTLSKAALEIVLLERGTSISPRKIISSIPELGKDARTTIFRLLEKVVDDSIIPELIALLDHEDWWVRLYGAKLLAEQSDTSAVKGLIKLLKDENKGVRLEAVLSLHKIRSERAVPKLCAALRDPDLKVQSAAIDALVDIADASAVKHLLEVLKDESEHSRRAAVEVLNEVATTKAIRDLVVALRDADWWVRVRAADALGTLGGPKVVDAVVGLLTEDDDFIRRYAVEILNAVPSERAVEPLIKALDDTDWWVRERSIDALAKTGDSRAVEPLLRLIRTDVTAAPLCLKALGEIKDPAAVETVCQLVDSENEEIRREAVEALNALSQTELSTEDKDRVTTVLSRTMVTRGKRAGMPLEVGRRNSRFGPEDAAKGPDPRPSSRPAEPAAAGSGAAGSTNPDGSMISPLKNSGDGGKQINFHKLSKDTVLLDRYRVIRPVGKGGFGAIYLVEDSAIQEEIIIKVLNPQLSMDDNAIRRFVQELKLTRKVTHKNVIRIYDFLDLGAAHAVSMEFFPGQDLNKILSSGGYLPPKRTLKIIAQTCEGLSAAHSAGVIHRDIKPANVLLGDRDEVKIVDFGLASAGQQMGSRLTKSGLLIGTPEYIAPEQISGDDVDHRADIYAMGVMMYEMLSGEKPFTAETPVKILFLHLEGDAKPLSSLVEGLSLDLEYLVSSCMARNPNDRPESADTLLEMIQRTLAEMDQAA